MFYLSAFTVSRPTSCRCRSTKLFQCLQDPERVYICESVLVWSDMTENEYSLTVKPGKIFTNQFLITEKDSLVIHVNNYWYLENHNFISWLERKCWHLNCPVWWKPDTQYASCWPHSYSMKCWPRINGCQSTLFTILSYPNCATIILWCRHL